MYTFQFRLSCVYLFYAFSRKLSDDLLISTPLDIHSISEESRIYSMIVHNKFKRDSLLDSTYNLRGRSLSLLNNTTSIFKFHCFGGELSCDPPSTLSIHVYVIRELIVCFYYEAALHSTFAVVISSQKKIQR